MRAHAGAIDDKDNIDGEEKEDKPTHADLLVDIGLTTHLFVDQFGEKYARVFMAWLSDSTDSTNSKNTIICTEKINDKCNSIYKGSKNAVSAVSPVKVRTRNVTMSLKGSHFKEWLAERFHTVYCKTAGIGSINSAITTLKGIARRRNIRQKLYNRVAPDPNGNGFWIDMCDKNCRAIHLTEEGWEIVDNPPILFRDFGQDPLVLPKKINEDMEVAVVHKFFDFVNVTNPTDQLMLMCIIISYFVPEIEHSIVGISGDHDSAKSMLCELIKRTVDPSATETLTMSRKEEGLAQQLYHNYVVCFDNLSSLNTWKSDMLCRAVTGAGLSKRKLFTDDEDVRYFFRRCVMLNGVNVVARNSDLLDRIIFFKLDKIENKKKKQEIYKEFEKRKSYIFGAMLNILVKAIRMKKNLNIKYHQRLADFHEWGCAIAVALGYTAEDFNKVYTLKFEEQNEIAISSSNVALALIEWFKENKDEGKLDQESNLIYFEMTPTEWFKEVSAIAKRKGIKTLKGWFPVDPPNFSKAVKKIRPNLESFGISALDHSDGSNWRS